MIRGWRIYYGNKGTFDSNDGTHFDAPKENVQVVLIFFEKNDGMGRPTRQMMSGADFYFWDGREWRQSFDDPSVVSGIVFYGKWMRTEEEFEVIRMKAVEDYNI